MSVINNPKDPRICDIDVIKNTVLVKCSVSKEMHMISGEELVNVMIQVCRNDWEIKNWLEQELKEMAKND